MHSGGVWPPREQRGGRVTCWSARHCAGAAARPRFETLDGVRNHLLCVLVPGSMQVGASHALAECVAGQQSMWASEQSLPGVVSLPLHASLPHGHAA